MADPASYRPAPGSIPDAPGVYRFRDEHGRIIYVGKARSLRSRLSSYFQDLSNLHARTQTMVTTAAAVEWTVVTTEVEALQLEYNWIKEFDPRFNVRYRDDKSYPSLAVTLNEEFPRLQVMRGAKKKGVRYFGPYAHAWAIRETLDLLLRVFPARTCSSGVFKRAGQVGRPCLLGYIGKCSAPCVGRVDAADAPGDRRRLLRLHGRADGSLPAPAGEGDAGRGRQPGLRASRPAARRHQGARARRREAGGRAGRRHRRRCRRVRRGPARGRRPGLLRPRRPGARAAWLGGRQGRGRHHRRPGRGLPPAGLRRRDGRQLEPAGAARGPGPGAARRCRRPGRLAVRPPGEPGGPPRASTRRQALADGDGRPQRRAGPGAAQDPARERPDQSRHRAPGDPGRPRPGGRPAAHRVLRRLQPAGQRRGRLDGRLRGRPGAQVRIPPLRHPRAGRSRRHRVDHRGHHATLPALSGRALRDRGAGRRPRQRRRPGRSGARRSTRTPAGRAASPTRRTSSSSTVALPR